jgi:hypothetical protein
MHDNVRQGLERNVLAGQPMNKLSLGAWCGPMIRVTSLRLTLCTTTSNVLLSRQ